MQIIRPQMIEPAALTSDVPLDDHPEWEPGTYDDGDRVLLGIEIYEALTETSDEPEEGAAKEIPTWFRIGFANRWRMFRDGRDSRTRQENGIEVSVQADQLVNGVALLGLEGLDVTVRMIDPVEGQVYERTESITDIGVGNWYDWYFLPYDIREDFVFLDLPPYSGAKIEVDIAAPSGGEAAAGRFVMGIVRDLGLTQHGSSVRSMDFSIRERDGFGNLRIVRRRQVNLVDYRVVVETNRVDLVKRELDRLRNRETLFVGSEQYTSTAVFGFYRDFDITISNPAISDATLEVEGY